MSISLPGYRYPDATDVALFNDRLLARVQRVPGVQAASLTTTLPMRRINEQSYALPGVPIDPNHLKVTDWARVTDDDVQTLGFHLLRGRNFTPEDVAKEQPDTALVNAAFARANWPSQDAIDKRFFFPGENGKDVTYTITGVIGDAHSSGRMLRRIPRFICLRITCAACCWRYERRAIRWIWRMR